MAEKNGKSANQIAKSKKPQPKGKEPKDVVVDSCNRKVQKRKLSDLKAHPKQEEHFLDLPDDKLIRLAESLETNGLKHPVEITTDNVIICGHQRVRAALRNGWEDIDVIVRGDLTGDAAVEAELLRDNLERRHLSRLREVRALKGQWDLVQELPGHAPDHLQGTLVEVVRRELGMSPKNSQRYLHVLNTPDPVQQAFDDGSISLVTAARVAGLSDEVQQQIADEIGDGNDPKQVVEAHLAKQKQSNQPRAWKVLSASLVHFDKAVEPLKDRHEELDQHHFSARNVQVLEDAQELITHLLARAGQPDAGISLEDLESE